MGKTLLLSLIMTLVLELPFAWLWGLRKGDILLVVWVNILTNPLVVLWNHVTTGFVLSILLPEAAAVTAEAVFFKRLGKKIPYPVLLAVCINTFSFHAAILIQYLFLIWR